MIRFIMMTCGYVENNKTSWLIYNIIARGREGFETKEQAIKELALDFYAKYKEEVLDYRDSKRNRKACCKEHIGKSEYCPKCGTKLTGCQFDEDDFKSYITHLHDTTCDSYGEAEFADGRHFVWWPWEAHGILKAKPEEILMIAECAEEVLYKALIAEKPELK